MMMPAPDRQGHRVPKEPAPARSWGDPRLPAAVRAALVVAAMTDEEKFAWISGPIALPSADAPKPDGALGSAAYYPAIPRLGLLAIQESDAGLGVTNPGQVRPAESATALPSTLLLGASFDAAIARSAGAVIGREARASGFHVMLAGGANLVRDPRGGRTFEYVSEDPLLTGVIAGQVIAGIQSAGVVSTIKHFVLNAQETGRVVVSSDLDEAAMRESDLLAFQIGIEQGQPGAVMTSYNLVNSVYASESDLIQRVLKGEWRYPGWVMSDWGGTHSTDRSALAGLDVESAADLDPEAYFGAALKQAVAAGRVPRERIDDMVLRILRSLFVVGVIDDPPCPGAAVDFELHRRIVQRAAEAGIVLLKNDGLLPLAASSGVILVIGAHAHRGVLSGGGSSQVTPVGSDHEVVTMPDGRRETRVYHPPSPVAAIQLEAPGARVEYLDGMDVAAAATAARAAQVVVLFATEWRSEGLDASGLALPHRQDRLIEAVAAANPRTVVVLETGGPVTMPWLPQVGAVLAAFYPGSGGGPAIAGILFGRVNPSGRLPLTFPSSEQQLPRPGQRDPATTTADPEQAGRYERFHVSYDIEGSDVGYRWYAREGFAPLFPFGFGVSYTTFRLSGLSVSHAGPRLQVAVTVENTGGRAGADVVQAYAGRRGDDGFVPRLGGFCRIELQPGEARSVTIDIDPRLLARYDRGPPGFVVATGRYDIQVGHHAGDAESLTATVELDRAVLD